jgi:hypothetical protein
MEFVRCFTTMAESNSVTHLETIEHRILAFHRGYHRHISIHCVSVYIVLLVRLGMTKKPAFSKKGGLLIKTVLLV